MAKYLPHIVSRILFFTLFLNACNEQEVREPAASQPTALPAHAEIPVQGMTCSSCENFLKQTLEMQDGITEASASHIDQKIDVQYDPELISPSGIVEIINRTNYKAFPPGTVLPASSPATAPGKSMH